MKKADLALMNEIMDGIVQTDEWTKLQIIDPGVQAAANQWRQAMESAKAHLPRAVYIELSDAHACEVGAIGDAAILYGIHVANTIRDIAARPSDLSKYILSIREATS